MATLIPSLDRLRHSNITEGERQVAEVLEKNLGDDCLIWFNPKIPPSNLEPDFLVLDPGRGLLILEVKDWRIETIIEADDYTVTLSVDSIAKRTKNPYKQVKAYGYDIKTQLERGIDLIYPVGNQRQGQLIFPYVNKVILTKITRTELQIRELEAIFGSNSTICQDEIFENVDKELFQEKMWSGSRFSLATRLNDRQINSIYQILKLPNKSQKPVIQIPSPNGEDHKSKENNEKTKVTNSPDSHPPIPTPPPPNNPEDEAEKESTFSLFKIADEFRDRGELAKAKEIYKQILDVVKKSGDRINESRALLELAKICNSQICYQETIDLAKEWFNTKPTILSFTIYDVNLFRELGKAYAHLRNYTKAIKLLELSLNTILFTNKLSDKVDAIDDTKKQLGICYLAIKDYQKAIGIYKQKLAIARENKKQSEELVILHTLGECYYNLKDYPNTIEYSLLQLEKIRQISDPSTEMTTLNRLGESYYYLENKQQAYNRFEQMLTVANELGDISRKNHAINWLDKINEEIDSRNFTTKIPARNPDPSELPKKSKKKDWGGPILGPQKVNVTVFGPRGVGKTSLLASLYQQFNRTIGDTNIQLTATNETSAILSKRLGELKSIFSDDSRKEFTTAGIGGTSEPQTFQFGLSKRGGPTIIDLLFHDFPGGYIHALQEEERGQVEKLLSDCAVVLIAIDTPSLMEKNSALNETINNPMIIGDMIINCYQNLTSPRLVLFVPIKCEKYLPNKSDELIVKLKLEYQSLLAFLSSKNNISVAITPVQTLGNVIFDRIENQKFYFIKLRNEYQPKNCEQPLRYLLRFLLKLHFQQKNLFAKLVRSLANIITLNKLFEDESFKKAADIFAKECKKDNGFAIIQDRNNWLQG